MKKTKKKKSVLNAKASKENRDRAIERVARGCDGSWGSAAYLMARKVAEQLKFFTTDDVWKSGLAKPHEPRSLGAVMLSLQRDGIIVPTKQFKATAQPSRHAAPVRLWASAIYVE